VKAAGAVDVRVTADPDIVAHADRVVLPGVGAFAHCMAALSGIDGMIAAMEQRVRAQGIPFLGICVGMQLLADEGVEHKSTRGLGWIPGTVRAIAPATGLKIPHMGWNDVVPSDGVPLIRTRRSLFPAWLSF
jgi:imidazole glycerol-phosphate synthase subunit HisH